jgi:hypothetical protein
MTFSQNKRKVNLFFIKFFLKNIYLTFMGAGARAVPMPAVPA